MRADGGVSGNSRGDPLADYGLAPAGRRCRRPDVLSGPASLTGPTECVSRKRSVAGRPARPPLGQGPESAMPRDGGRSCAVGTQAARLWPVARMAEAQACREGADPPCSVVPRCLACAQDCAHHRCDHACLFVATVAFAACIARVTLIRATMRTDCVAWSRLVLPCGSRCRGFEPRHPPHLTARFAGG